MKRTGKLILTTALAVTGALALTASPALAAGEWHPISGTVKAGGAWYTSTNVRTVASGNSAIKASFNSVPASNLAFRVLNYNTGNQLGSTIYAPPLSAQTIASGVSAGTRFVNSFKQQNPCTGCHNYEFDGSEYY